MWKPLGDFLESAINRVGAKRSVDAAVIVENSQALILQIVPELRPADLEVISYRNGTLTIGVVDPAIGEELRMRNEAILEALQHTFGEKQVLRLRFKPLEKEKRLTRFGG